MSCCRAVASYGTMGFSRLPRAFSTCTHMTSCWLKRLYCSSRPPQPLLAGRAPFHAGAHHHTPICSAHHQRHRAHPSCAGALPPWCACLGCCTLRACAHTHTRRQAPAPNCGRLVSCGMQRWPVHAWKIGLEQSSCTYYIWMAMHAKVRLCDGHAGTPHHTQAGPSCNALNMRPLPSPAWGLCQHVRLRAAAG